MLVRAEAGFDPTAIPRILRDAGFTAVDLEVTAVGTVSRQEELLVLEVPPDGRRWILAGGEGCSALEESLPGPDSPVRVRGRLHPAHGDHPAGLTVEEWSSAADEP